MVDGRHRVNRKLAIRNRSTYRDYILQKHADYELKFAHL